MLRKAAFFVFMFVMIAGITLVSSEKAFAGFYYSLENGNFESDYFWNWDGNAGYDCTDNVINGNCSGFVSTHMGVNDVCSWLYSWDVFPQYVPKAVNVSFKVRYKSQHGYDPIEDIYDNLNDPFHASLFTGAGSVNLFTISTNGINAATGFKVKNLDTGLYVPAPPTMPNFWFVDGEYAWGTYWDYATDVYEVTGSIPYSMCDPVYIRFGICDAVTWYSPSGAAIDDVQVTFVNASSSFGNTRRDVVGPPIPCDFQPASK